MSATASLGLRLLERLGPDGVAFSPLGVRAALDAIREGASGAAREALDEVLGPEREAALEVDDAAVALALAHAAWIAREYRLLIPIAEGRTVDFADPGAPAEVNAWAAERTRGMIRAVVDGFRDDEVFALVGAAYFEGAWTEPFEPAAPASFTRADGRTVEAPTMTLQTRLEYGEHAGLRAVRLPYGNTGDLGFVAVIAADGPAPPRVGPDEWRALRGAMTARDGTVALPRLHVQATLDLRGPLTALGLGPAFEPSRDWDGLLEGPGAKSLSRVLQRARVDVEEQGTRAAAVTVATARVVSSAVDPFDLRFDRPFLWAIEDRESGTLLFLGIVTDPTSEEST